MLIIMRGSVSGFHGSLKYGDVVDVDQAHGEAWIADGLAEAHAADATDPIRWQDPVTIYGVDLAGEAPAAAGAHAEADEKPAGSPTDELASSKTGESQE